MTGLLGSGLCLFSSTLSEDTFVTTNLQNTEHHLLHPMQEIQTVVHGRDAEHSTPVSMDILNKRLENPVVAHCNTPSHSTDTLQMSLRLIMKLSCLSDWQTYSAQPPIKYACMPSFCTPKEEHIGRNFVPIYLWQVRTITPYNISGCPHERGECFQPQHCNTLLGILKAGNGIKLKLKLKWEYKTEMETKNAPMADAVFSSGTHEQCALSLLYCILYLAIVTMTVFMSRAL